MKVKLSDIAREYNSRSNDKKISVGLDHIDSGNLKLSRWDEEKENTFNKSFKKGHILFGRRRAYLKKACVAPFDGVCSGDITVIEAIPEKVIKEFLPFIIQNDSLFDYAVEKSAGSLSPRVKWEVLKEYEFELPELKEQQRLAKVLWKIEEAKALLSSNLRNISNLRKQTIQSEYDNLKNYEIKKLKNITEIQNKSGIKAGEALSTGKFLFFTSGTKNGFYNKYLLDGEYLIFNTGGSMLIEYYSGKFAYSTDTLIVKCKDDLTKYLYYYLSINNEAFDQKYFRGSGLRHLNKNEFFNIEIKIPKQDYIKQFISRLEKIDIIKGNLYSEYNEKTLMQQQIIKEALNV